MSDSKTHYRKVYKSDHLGVADLEDFVESKHNLIFTIDHVKQQFGVSVAGRKGNHNIAYFKEDIKPLVLNATNAKILKAFCGGSAFVEDWKNVLVQLYIDPSVKLKGDIVGGVRIHPEQPVAAKPELTPDNTNRWNQAIAAYKRDGDLNAVLSRMSISHENQQLILSQANV